MSTKWWGSIYRGMARMGELSASHLRPKKVSSPPCSFKKKIIVQFGRGLTLMSSEKRATSKISPGKWVVIKFSWTPIFLHIKTTRQILLTTRYTGEFNTSESTWTIAGLSDAPPVTRILCSGPIITKNYK